MKEQIILSNVCYSIDGKSILEDINISIAAGEWVAICGPNGAGKSTLLNLMLNILGLGFNKKRIRFLEKSKINYLILKLIKM